MCLIFKSTMRIVRKRSYSYKGDGFSIKRMMVEAILGWSGRRRHGLDALDDSHVQLISTLVDSLKDLVHDLRCTPRCKDAANSGDHGSNSGVCNDVETCASEDLLCDFFGNVTVACTAGKSVSKDAFLCMGSASESGVGCSPKGDNSNSSATDGTIDLGGLATKRVMDCLESSHAVFMKVNSLSCKLDVLILEFEDEKLGRHDCCCCRLVGGWMEEK